MIRKVDNKLILLFSFIIVLVIIPCGTSYACTVITLDTSDGTLFGYNEDRMLYQFSQQTTIYFNPAIEDSFAYTEVRAEEPGLTSLRIGINSEGVAVSANALSPHTMNNHPGRLYTWKYHSLMHLILQRCADIEDVITLAGYFNYPGTMGFQIHAADKNGRAVILSPGIDGEIFITEKDSTFFVSTNVNRAAIDEGLFDTRNTVAHRVYEKSDSATKSVLTNTLKAVHQDSFETATYYSVIIDLSAQKLDFFLYHDFSTAVSIDIQEELAKNTSSIILADLFEDGQEIFDTGKKYLQITAPISLIIRILFAALAIFILVLLVIKLIRITKREVSGKFLQIIKILLIHLSGSVFSLLNAVLMPWILFGNYLQGTVTYGVFRPEFIVYIILGGIQLIFAGLWIRRRLKLSNQ